MSTLDGGDLPNNIIAEYLADNEYFAIRKTSFMYLGQYVFAYQVNPILLRMLIRGASEGQHVLKVYVRNKESQEVKEVDSQFFATQHRKPRTPKQCLKQLRASRKRRSSKCIQISSFV